jgi:predicted RNase H-like HicB family nuclease
MPNLQVHVERDPQTGLLVGSIPGWPGAYTQGATPEELAENLREVVAMLLEDDSGPHAQELRAELYRRLS